MSERPATKARRVLAALQRIGWRILRTSGRSFTDRSAEIESDKRSAWSRNGVPVGLPDERWVHITEEHSELAGHLYDVLEAIADPSVIYGCSSGEFLAVRQFEPGKHLVVAYREVSPEDRFVITASLTRRVRQLERRTRRWPS